MNASVRLLYVAGRFPKVSETFVVNEVLGQLDRGHDVRVLSIRPPELVGAAHEETLLPFVRAVPRVPIPRAGWPSTAQRAVPEERFTRRIYAMAAAQWAIGGGLDGFRPDVVHAHFANLPALLAAFIARGLATPYTFMAHATDYMVKMSDELLRRRVLHADRAFTISEAARADVVDRARLEGSQAERVEVVRAAVRLLAEPSVRVADGPLTIVAVARLVPMKGLDTALRAFAQMRSGHPLARFHVVGDGPERTALERLSGALGVEDAVTFFGTMDNQRTQEIIAAADIAVLPCRRDRKGMMDGIPVFLMEAGALELPIVTTAVSGLPELVEHDRGGLITAPDDVDAIAAALARLAADPQLRERMGRAMHLRVTTEFAIDRQLDRLAACWDDLLRVRR